MRLKKLIECSSLGEDFYVLNFQKFKILLQKLFINFIIAMFYHLWVLQWQKMTNLISIWLFSYFRRKVLIYFTIKKHYCKNQRTRVLNIHPTRIYHKEYAQFTVGLKFDKLNIVKIKYLQIKFIFEFKCIKYFYNYIKKIK